MTLTLERIYDRSVYFYIYDLFVGTHVNVVDEFPIQPLTTPTVSVDYKNLRPLQIELGNTKRLKMNSWYVDVFAQNKSQRDEIGFTILDALETCIPVYDYNLGFPPTVVPQLGCLEVRDISMDIHRVLPQLVDKLHYRATISFTATYNQL